jgi:hypothetical protein
MCNGKNGMEGSRAMEMEMEKVQWIISLWAWMDSQASGI